MDAVTYPDEMVRRELDEHFAGLTVDLATRHPDFPELAARTRITWAPTFHYLDARGKELRRRTGWLPPGEFLAELRFVRALHLHQSGDHEAARQRLETIAEDHPDTAVAPEALFWAGAAAYLGSGREMAALAEPWQILIDRYPDSTWGQGASTIEDWER